MVTAEPIVLKHGELFLGCDPRGDIAPELFGTGLYFRDMRHLSHLLLRLSDVPLQVLGPATEATDRLTVVLSNAEVTLSLPAHALLLERSLALSDDLTHSVTLSNLGRADVDVVVELTVGADFRDMFDVREFARYAEGAVASSSPGDTDELRYASADDTRYVTAIDVSDGAQRSASSSVSTEPATDTVARRSPATLTYRWPVHLPPGATRTLRQRIAVHVEGRDGRASAPAPLVSVSAAALGTIDTSNPLFDAVLRRSSTDLAMLTTPLPGGGAIIAAGIPWYVAPFGRDSAITARMVLPFQPALARDTLRFLASVQGQVTDPWRDEQPGKIVHEVRFGEIARLDLMPQARYYGTVDATPLFLSLLADYLDWTADLPLLTEFLPHVERALAWIDQFGDSDGDGLLDYQTQSARGLSNQGWKDSEDALQRDGHPVPGPIALVEPQGYVVAAWRGLAPHLAQAGHAALAERLAREADALSERIEDRFWSDALGCYAFALDGHGQRVDEVTSNPGHLLASGAVRPDRAAATATRLLADDIFSGWGVRTLWTRTAHYHPVSYHNGSVWPHDNAFLLWGLRRYGRLPELDQLATALYDAAIRLPRYRLPELFCGFPRDPSPDSIPVAYPVSCSPQAWSAATPFVMVETLLGLRADALARRLHVAPWLPAWLESIAVHGLHLAGATVDLAVRGRHADVTVDILRNDAGIEIQTGAPPELGAGR